MKTQDHHHHGAHEAEKLAAESTNCESNKVLNMEKVDMESLVVLEDVKHLTEKKSCSFFHTVINMIGMLTGLGQLSTPYALEKGGWISAFLIVGVGISCAYSAHLLGKCLKKNPKSRDYKDIGEHAYGSKGRIIVATFVCIHIFLVLVSYTISLRDNLSLVFLDTNLEILSSWTNVMNTSQILTTLAILVALPSIWLRNLSSLSFLSIIGILMSFLIFLSVACTAIFGNIKANHKIPVLQIQNIPVVSGLYAFGYGGHVVFPNLYTAMKDPSKFTKVSIVSFTIMTILYVSIAFMGAKLFGPEVSSQITLSMPRKLIFTKIALWATVLTPLTKYALSLAPFAIQLQENILPKQMKDTTKMIIRGFIGSTMLLVILVLALVVPYFEHVLGLTGSLFSLGICIVFPCSFYTKIFWNKISWIELIVNVILIAIGIILGVSGTISSSKMILLNLRSSH